MLAERLDDIYTQLTQRLSAWRLAHVLGVCHAAVQLASIWKCDVDAVLAAALLHDVAKETPRDEMEARLRAAGALTAEDETSPGIWHALAGEIAAREEFGIGDPAVGRAIRLHPTGDEDMGRVESVVFLADYIEPTRRFDGVDELRRLARRDLTAAADQAVLRKTEHVAQQGKILHSRSLRARQAALGRTRKENAQPA